MQDERRDPDGRQDLRDVALHDHALEGRRGAGAGARPHVPDVPGLELRVVRDGGAVLGELALEELGLTPGGRDLAEPGPPLVVALRPLVVRRAPALDAGFVEHEPDRPLRVRRREQDRDANRLVGREDRRPLDLGGVHDGPDVVHAGLERRHVPQSIGQAHPALVEHRHPRERRKPLHVPHEQRLVPHGSEIREAPANDDQIDRARPERLVRDADLAALRIADLRDLHAAIVIRGFSRTHSRVGSCPQSSNARRGLALGPCSSPSQRTRTSHPIRARRDLNCSMFSSGPTDPCPPVGRLASLLARGDRASRTHLSVHPPAHAVFVASTTARAERRRASRPRTAKSPPSNCPPFLLSPR